MICCLEESYVGEFLGRVAIVTVIVIVGVDRKRTLSGKWDSEVEVLNLVM